MTNNRRATQQSLKAFPKRHLALAVGLMAVVSLLLIIIPSEPVSAKRTEIPLDIETSANLAEIIDNNLTQPTAAGSSQTQKAETPAAPPIHWKSVTIKSGDTLSVIFSKQGLSANTLHKLVSSSKEGKSLASIRPGQTLEFGLIDGELQQLRYIRTRLESLHFSRNEDSFTAEEVIRKPEIRQNHVAGVITDSLFLSANRAGLPDKLTMELANIFGWDIDFVLDIRSNDSFSLIYEEKFLDGKSIGYGDILAAEFQNRGETYRAIRYTDNKGKTDYYSPEGESLRKSFIRTPVDFTRISSGYNPNRKHPIFKTNRPHRAVDYAAPSGTPIKASGDGVIHFAGKQRGYGNVVYINHPNSITTVYAHMRNVRKGMRKGIRVKQGQVIGYVGMTGYATGPHLHYEFRVNGVHRNPLKVKLPDAKPLPKSEMAHFGRITRVMLAELETRQSGTLLAAKSNDK
ncbi:OapA family protein [Kistimonas asteriae]|uniref:OapA family protein n=1 Tax=Kistimonas asteriae TaxID=517724 RepID=UPI001BAABFA6|nr:peptidoglycan DD-metalloendopeptidase family protein [Kistimonas asteriae]